MREEGPFLVAAPLGAADAATDRDRSDVAGYRRPQRRRQALAARATLRCLLAETTGIDGADWTLARRPTGGLAALAPGGRRGPEVSLAHAGDWVACALAPQGTIGVDIEMPRPGRSVVAIAESVLSAAERAAVMAEGEAALLACWTLREAIGKALGEGVGAGFGVGGDIVLAARDTVCSVPVGRGTWVLGQRRFGAGSLAVAWLRPSR